MADYTRFIILSSGRSGSNMLMFLLKSSPEVRCFGEVFNFMIDLVDFDEKGYDNHNPDDRALRDADPAAFLQQRIFAEHPEPIRAVGFKAMYQELPFLPALCTYLQEQRDVRILHSKRRNLLRLIVSTRIAEKTGTWIAREPMGGGPGQRLRRALRLSAERVRAARKALRQRNAPAASTKAVVLTPQECQFGFAWLREQADEYAERFRSHSVLDVYYEDLVDATGHTLRQVQDFLHLSPRPLTTATSRQNPEPLRELIANYDELYEAFCGTEFAQFFDE